MLSIQNKLKKLDSLENRFFKRFKSLKRNLTFPNSKYEDIYTLREEQARFQFEVHRQNIIKGKSSSGTKRFMNNLQGLTTRTLKELALEKATGFIDEFLNVIRGQSEDDYYEAIAIINNMPDKDIIKLTKQRGFFINYDYGSEGRKNFEKYIKAGYGDYDTNTIELYKLRYFVENGTLDKKIKKK